MKNACSVISALYCWHCSLKD